MPTQDGRANAAENPTVTGANGETLRRRCRHGGGTVTVATTTAGPPASPTGKVTGTCNTGPCIMIAGPSESGGSVVTVTVTVTVTGHVT